MKNPNQFSSILDKRITGVISGIIVPAMMYGIVYYVKVQDVHNVLFSEYLVISHIIPIILSHCILPNLLLFFIFNGLNWMKAAQGILGTTIVLTLLIFAVKFIFRLI